MTKRQKTAKIVQGGACNPRPIANGLLEAIDECRAEGVDPTTDGSVLLILHQLTWVLTNHDICTGNERLQQRWNEATAQMEQVT